MTAALDPGHASGGDESFRVADDGTLTNVITEYARTCRRFREIAAKFSLTAWSNATSSAP
ncbi:hypothetical protein A5641_28960 [Mycobacterium sp. 1554424.7]|nr:hypothetical protein A5641_28960 [Mycobacterium sp. 1554424.7]